ncbi:ORC-CDC6 family AAA ATPase [Viscerimonas tarda]
MQEKINPFEIKTPEQISAQDIVDLFVDVFTDFNQVLEKGHTFLNGPRGSGKSMMFRYIMPDCQIIAKNKEVNSLDFFSLYVPIKLTDINIPDLGRLENHAEYILNEHLLATYVLSKSIESIINVFDEKLNQYSSEIEKFYKEDFLRLVSYSGYKISEYTSDKGKDYFRQMADIVSNMTRECTRYCKSIALSKNIDGYYGSIIDFIDFVYPFLLKLKQLPFFAKDNPFFVLIDDAGYLNLPQTKVLNTWVSYRTTKDVCFKISTQLDYKTYLTTNGKRIDSPHDYSEVNISTRYSSNKSTYNERIEQIVKRRINKYLNIPIDDVNVRFFFPEDGKQKQEIAALAEELREKHKNPEKDYAANDAAKRYSVPEYIKRQQQQHRSGFNYSYAGFDQLVAISSGIIRHFLAPAQEMYSEYISTNKGQIPDFIPDSIQDSIIKKYSTEFLTVEFDKIRTDNRSSQKHTDNADMLYNLVDSLGQLFHKILVSDLTERRVFSVALTDRPNDQLREILDLGEQYGYLHKSTIGNKQGTGRNRLYILSRILAPNFKLDPTSFAGYQFMKSETLAIALTDRAKFLSCFSKKINSTSSNNEPRLFDNIENFYNDEDY